jgi:hypothetical protein
MSKEQEGRAVSAVSGTGLLRYIYVFVGHLIGWLGVLFSWVILAYQVLGWFSTGHWQGVSLSGWIVPSGSTSDFWRWLAEPQSWYGLQRLVWYLLYDFQVWILLMGGSFAICIWFGKLDKPFEDEAMKEQRAMRVFVITNGKRYDTRACPKYMNADAFLNEHVPSGWMLVGTTESEEEAEAIIEKHRAIPPG